ncbi:uncharacterized protein LAJ45_00704 [Morchella importuna]|uniref:uncharacterized protein n=1 Tax=Morchella importuna TaxID=1174673 RepID=UPI001E8E2141|nr:uncharacterized protein LAJ45_00704 [Morchella importuna]KAH8155694.1 hypothetical protein LAJ45_00704 [Morchella importuna]
MAPHAEPSPPPSPTADGPKHSSSDNRASSDSNSESRPDSQFFSHLSTFPLLVDSQNLLQSHLPRIFTTFLNKANSLTKTYIPPSILHRADSFGNTALTQIEHTFPIVKAQTSQFTSKPKAVYDRVITRPVTSVQTAMDTYKAAGKERMDIIKHNVYDAYKTYAEPTIGVYTDNYVRKINDRLEEALDTNMPKSYKEAVVEGNDEEKAAQHKKDEIELYRSMRIAKNAMERGKARFYVPLQNMVQKTADDVKEGGTGIKADIRSSPSKMKEGAVHLWNVMGEEFSKQKTDEGSVGVKGTMKVVYRVGERCADFLLVDPAHPTRGSTYLTIKEN